MKTTRRTFLGAGLAAVSSSVACRPERAKLLLPKQGEIIGMNSARGHRIREAIPAAAPKIKTKILIAGGGVAGLAAAWRLAGAGIEDFLLLELEDVAGGTARAGTTAGQAHPWGAHYVSAPRREQRAMVRLLDQVGAIERFDDRGEPVIDEACLVRDPEERLFHRGRWTEGLWLPGGDAEDRRQLDLFQAEIDRWIAFRDGAGRRAFTLPVSACSDDAEVTELDRITMADWLDQRRFTSTRLRWYVDYSCRDDYGARIDQVSAWAGLFYFAARVAGKGEESAPFVTWPEGNGRLIAHFVKAAGDRVKTGWTVADVSPKEQDVEVTAIDSSGVPAGFSCERVIVCAPRAITNRIVRPLRENGLQNKLVCGSWMVANLALKDRPSSRGFPLCWDNVIYDSDALGYIAATHQSGRDRGPTILTYYRPMFDADADRGRRELAALTWSDAAELVLKDLVRAHPDLPQLIDRLDVIKHGHAMVRPVPGTMFDRSRQEAAKPRGRIHFAHSDLSGVALFEEALDHGLRAAEETLAALGMTEGSWR